MNLHRFQGLIHEMNGTLVSKAMNVLEAWTPALPCPLSFISFSRPPHTRIYLSSILTSLFQQARVRGPCLALHLPLLTPDGLRLWCFSLHSEQGIQNKPEVQPLGKLRQQDKWYPISKKRKEKRKKRIREEEGGNCGGRRNRTVFYLVTNPSLGSVGVLFSVFCPSD